MPSQPARKRPAGRNIYLLGTPVATRVSDRIGNLPRATKTLAVRVAADMVGGPRKLRDALRARSADVAAWLSGRVEPPREVFLRVIEMILDDLDAGAPRLASRRRPRKGAVVLRKIFRRLR
jgi:hypothetical protein